MKIIKQGNLVSNDTLSGNCQNCGCLFECKSFEADKKVGTIKEKFAYTYSISCPTSGCGKRVNLIPIDSHNPS